MSSAAVLLVGLVRLFISATSSSIPLLGIEPNRRSSNPDAFSIVNRNFGDENTPELEVKKHAESDVDAEDKDGVAGADLDEAGLGKFQLAAKCSAVISHLAWKVSLIQHQGPDHAVN